MEKVIEVKKLSHRYGSRWIYRDLDFSVPPGKVYGLLFEGHLAYEFMSIAQIERFYAPHYPLWNRDRYYDLVNLLGLRENHRIDYMSDYLKERLRTVF